MSRSATDHALVVWMVRDGEIYSPAMTLCKSSEEGLARDLWECTHAGVCHSVYRYGTHANGGGYCREITQEIAARLGRLSLTTRRRPAEMVRVFLQAFGVEFFGEGDEHAQRDVPTHPPFEMSEPRPSETSRRVSRRKSRTKHPDPDELRAQPQFKLPIAGGKDAGSNLRERALEGDDKADDAGVERLSLKDVRPADEQTAAWERFDRRLREMGVKPGAEPPSRHEDVRDEASEPRRSQGFRS